LARQHGAVVGEFVDITEGLDRPAYVNIAIEAIEKQLKTVPDYMIVPFGAGILCNEIIDYIKDKGLNTKVVPVSSGNPNTIAVMLYGPIWVDTGMLEKEGKAFSRHEPIDRKGRAREPYVVYNVSDADIREAMAELKQIGITAEPSGASGIALLKHLRSIHPEYEPERDSVLIINTGNGLLNYA
jgi:threonine dehydratase